MLQDFVPRGLPFLDAVILVSLLLQKRRVLGNPFLSHKARVSISQLSVPFFFRSVSSDSVEQPCLDGVPTSFQKLFR